MNSREWRSPGRTNEVSTRLSAQFFLLITQSRARHNSIQIKAHLAGYEGFLEPLSNRGDEKNNSSLSISHRFFNLDEEIKSPNSLRCINKKKIMNLSSSVLLCKLPMKAQFLAHSHNRFDLTLSVERIKYACLRSCRPLCLNLIKRVWWSHSFEKEKYISIRETRAVSKRDLILTLSSNEQAKEQKCFRTYE